MTKTSLVFSIGADAWAKKWAKIAMLLTLVAALTATVTAVFGGLTSTIGAVVAAALLFASKYLDGMAADRMVLARLLRNVFVMNAPDASVDLVMTTLPPKKRVKIANIGQSQLERYTDGFWTEEDRTTLTGRAKMYRESAFFSERLYVAYSNYLFLSALTVLALAVLALTGTSLFGLSSGEPTIPNWVNSTLVGTVAANLVISGFTAKALAARYSDIGVKLQSAESEDDLRALATLYDLSRTQRPYIPTMLYDHMRDEIQEIWEQVAKPA